MYGCQDSNECTSTTEPLHLEMISNLNLSLNEGPSFQLVQQNQLPQIHVIGKSRYYRNKVEYLSISSKKW